MKTILKSLILLVFALTIFNCDNDDGDPITSPNEDVCNFQGLTFLDTGDNTQTLIPDSELTTDFFYTSSNGPEVEIYDTDNPGDFWFLTEVVEANASGVGRLNIGGTIHNVNVTCQRTGSAVNEEMRFDVTANGLEAEFCVKINEYH